MPARRRITKIRKSGTRIGKWRSFVASLEQTALVELSVLHAATTIAGAWHKTCKRYQHCSHLNVQISSIMITSTSPDVWEIDEADFPADGPVEEKWRFLLRYAVLAPSPFNTQPWLFQLREKTLNLFWDNARSLPVLDPEGRGSIISCGAALMNLRLAIHHYRHSALLHLLPSAAEPRLLARLELMETPHPILPAMDREDRDEELDPKPAILRHPIPPDEMLREVLISDFAKDLAAVPQSSLRPDVGDEELFYAICRRMTSRGCLQNKLVPAEFLDQCREVAVHGSAWLHVVSDEQQRQAVTGLIEQADREQARNGLMRREKAQWIHPRHSEAEDGIPAHTFGMSRLFDAMFRHRQLAARFPQFEILGTAGDAPIDWLAAGQALQGALLQATASGLSASFFNQPIQLKALRSRLTEAIGLTGFPQVLLRLGYDHASRHTPRRPADEVLIKPREKQACS
jgi:hypothetical protein